MTDERLGEILRSALPPTSEVEPTRDLWPVLAAGGHVPVRWSWADISVATAVALGLTIFPECLWLLAYHL